MDNIIARQNIKKGDKLAITDHPDGSKSAVVTKDKKAQHTATADVSIGIEFSI